LFAILLHVLATKFLVVKFYICHYFIFQKNLCGGTDAAVFQLPEISKPMAYNVPAVYDVFASPIKEMRNISRAGKLWVECGVGMRPQADRPSHCGGRGAVRPRSAYSPVMRSGGVLHFFYYFLPLIYIVFTIID
jgi:hypothetical protein